MADLSKHVLPYVKTLGSIGNQYTVWAVDGEWVRAHVEADFRNAGNGWRDPHIPREEIWIDWTTAPEKEWEFFIHRMVFEIELLKSGVPLPEASRLSSEEEKQERGRRKMLPALSRSDYGSVDVFLSKMGTATVRDRKVEVILVDGTDVRDLLDANFFSGGHGLVYAYIPESQIWIEGVLSPQERLFTLFHELREYRSMLAGKVYDAAHAEAARIETVYRQHPERLPEAIAAMGFSGGSGKIGASKNRK